MNQETSSDLESDPRFPSGPWIGFFLQKEMPGRHMMELRLTFQQGSMTGEGRDRVGAFVVRGRYELADGKCYWTKRYLAKHDVFYQGYNEGKGIWGFWEIPSNILLGKMRGGFHIWPEGMADPSNQHLTAKADVPVAIAPPLEEMIPAEAEPIGVGTGP